MFAKAIAIGETNLELFYSACIRHIESQSSSFQLRLLLGLAKGRTCSNAHTEQLKPVPNHTGKCILCTLNQSHLKPSGPCKNTKSGHCTANRAVRKTRAWPAAETKALAESRNLSGRSV